jgi:hypothetical protein
MAKYNVYVEDVSVEAVFNKLHGVEGAKLLLRDELILTPKGVAPTDTIIRITRPVKPTYPDWVKKVMHPELEDVGLGEYDLASIDPWLHDGQRNGCCITGHHIYEDFKRNDSLKTCLGLRDGKEIQKKGIAVFRHFFGGKAVFLWKSVVLNSYGVIFVPYLCENSDEVVVDWHWLGRAWNGFNPAARFAS